MIKLQLLLAVVTFALSVYCLVEVISTSDDRTRNLPKLGWLLVVLFFPLVGSVAWLVAGRPQDGTRRVSRRRPSSRPPSYEQPGRLTPPDPVKDAEFLRQVRERAEEQRRRHEQARRERERTTEPEPEPEQD
ncbi:PLD nuclease N-terminal domain-containing protein [Nocardioides sp.]|uniref:PLD nuclease N-terminal domain-containing protein n=1 Tax=Nocardioides sp. TaxID=35761 RepID=UPI003565B3A5